MIQELITWGPLFLLVGSIGISFGWSMILRRVVGFSPYAFGSRDTAHDFLGAIFRRAIGVFVAFFLFRGIFPEWEHDFGRLDWLADESFRLFGLGLVLISVIWIGAAQLEMGRSWRIGIRERERPKLVTSGLFSISRNPVFLGMIAGGIGLFLASPTVVTMMALTATWLGIQVQVRLEEQYLSSVLGAEYQAYRQRVRRWLGRR
jgi:protein-S-isoprenylcysteine O-methyltransferase Ste14